VTGALKLADRIDATVDAVGRTTAWVTFALVLLMAGNTLASYLFSLSSVWAQELEWHLLVPICLIGMAWALRRGEHVRVDVFYAGYPPRLKAAVDFIAALGLLAVSLYIIKVSVPYVMQSWRIGEGSANPGGVPYRYLLKAFIPAGFALFALQTVSDAIRAAGRMREN
jgi:TRAP-type mannitol/chloroaromatic compound transport system permease small subunit